MKAIPLLTLILLAGSLPLSAAVHTVSNNNNFPADYSDLQTAIDAAADHDTLYVYGTETSYGAVTMDHPLTLIGSGHNPQIQAITASLIGDITMTSGASGSVISGFKFPEQREINPAAGTNDVIVENCYFYSEYLYNNYHFINGSDCDNWILRGNVFVRTSAYYVKGVGIGADNDNWLITNNILAGNYSYLVDANLTTVFSNNLIITDRQLFQGCSSATISNNIFLETSSNLTDLNTGCTACLMNHNLTYSRYADDNALALPLIPDANNSGSNNLNNADPILVNFPEDASGFDYAHDYHLDSGSPAIGSGTGNTDMGVYGGVSNFLFSQYGYPDIPRIYYLNVQNAMLPEDGTLKIEISGTTTR